MAHDRQCCLLFTQAPRQARGDVSREARIASVVEHPRAARRLKTSPSSQKAIANSLTTPYHLHTV